MSDNIIKRLTQKLQLMDKIKNDFRFDDYFYAKFNFSTNKKDVAVHVRRQDYVSNKNYILIPSKYYIDYFKQHPELKFYIFSDDYSYPFHDFTVSILILHVKCKACLFHVFNKL